jgi:hypothetical protein
LQVCQDATAALDGHIKSSWQARPLIKRLKEKFNMRYAGEAALCAQKQRRPSRAVFASAVDQQDTSTNDVCDPEDGPDLEEFDSLAKAVRTLVLRYASSPEPLRTCEFEWVHPPLRLQGETATELKLTKWVDHASSAADSSLYSSMGIWISPWAKYAFLVGALSFIANGITGLQYLHTNPVIFASSWAVVLWLGWMSYLLHIEERDRAMAFVWVIIPICLLFQWGEAISSLTRCWGPYSDSANTASYTTEWIGFNFMQPGLAFITYGARTHPRQTFWLFFVCYPSFLVLNQCWFLHAGSVGFGAISAWLYGNGIFFHVRRKDALRQARSLDAKDTIRYTKLWEALTASPSFCTSLEKTFETWEEVQVRGECKQPCKPLCDLTLCPPPPPSKQANAKTIPKMQTAKNLFTLLQQADLLNDLLSQKLRDIASSLHCEFHRSDVKNEGRALQKSFRSYCGHWEKLCDLCRGSLVFESMEELHACLHVIADDPEIDVIRADNLKMRFRKDFDAATLSGGYRDIQLCVRLNTAEARLRGVEKHLAEVQLHLSSVLALKSEGGHANYVMRRNLRGV